ncbi:ankyrin repeat-containing domain protein [Aspergillus karnatakaensis]|uniref:ankyrin repeat domain-containing protein n=1 Tax=Aspergillus karnatakaensis TaxID=1810916 RepID=UPI003CCDF348
MIPCKKCGLGFPRVTERHKQLFCQHPLTNAAMNGSLELMRYLLDLGSDINVSTNLGHTPLMLAASGGFLPVVQELYERGCQVSHIHDATLQRTKTPLQRAAMYGHLEVVKYLLSKAEDMERAKLINVCFPHAGSSGSLKLVEHLLDHGADINARDPTQRYGPDYLGDTALSNAASGGHSGVVRYLLDRGADPCLPIGHSDNFDTALDRAIDRGRDKVVAILLELDPSKPDMRTKNALRAGNKAVIEVLLTKHQPRPDGDYNPLALAARRGSPDLIGLFLDQGFDETAGLLQAVKWSNNDAVELFLGRRTAAGMTKCIPEIVQEAFRSEAQTIIRALLSYGAPIFPKDRALYGSPDYNEFAALANQFPLATETDSAPV